MKYLKRLLLATLLILIIYSPVANASETPVQMANHHLKSKVNNQYNPESMLITTQQGQILYRYHQDKSVDPASTAKLMTTLLVLEDIKSGKIDKNDKVKISSRYEELSNLPDLTTFPLEKGETYTIDQLLKQALLESSNAASIILSEKVENNSSDFTDRMNKKAKSLGMTHTHFTNPSGADIKLIKEFAPKSYRDESYSKTTAYDMSLLAHDILKHHPEILNITKLKSDTQHDKKLENTNLSLPGLSEGKSGVDGLKTGTSDRGYNLVLTAKKQNLRVNTLLYNMKPYPDERANHLRQKVSNAGLQEAFDNYEYKKVLSKGEHKINGQTYNVKQDLYDVVPKKMSHNKFKVTQHNRVVLDYPRHFIKGTSAPSVKVEANEQTSSEKADNAGHIVELLLLGVFIFGILMIIASVIFFKKK